jgi:hypothetical protein
MTPRHLEILQHSLGVDQYSRTPKGFRPFTRNHFCAGAGDEPDCRELIAIGLMQQHETTTWLPYFNCSVTEAGIAAMKAASPKPPVLSRSKRRYQAYLENDCNMTFGEWLKSTRDWSVNL